LAQALVAHRTAGPVEILLIGCAGCGYTVQTFVR